MRAQRATNEIDRSSADAARRRWTAVRAVAESRPRERIAAASAAICALWCSLDPGVPLAAGVSLTALLPAALVDVIDHRLPDRLVAGAALAGLTVLVGEVLIGGVAVDPAAAAWGVAAMAGPLFVAHVVAPSAMGFGDVKTAIVCGAALGLVDPVLGLLALLIGSAVSALVGLVLGRRTLPFGPGLVGGSIAAVMFVVLPLGVPTVVVGPPGGLAGPAMHEAER